MHANFPHVSHSSDHDHNTVHSRVKYISNRCERYPLLFNMTIERLDGHGDVSFRSVSSESNVRVTVHLVALWPKPAQ